MSGVRVAREEPRDGDYRTLSCEVCGSYSITNTTEGVIADLLAVALGGQGFARQPCLGCCGSAELEVGGHGADGRIFSRAREFAGSAQPPSVSMATVEP